MFKNPSLNNVFSKKFDGFYIFSTDTEIEIILRQLANILSKNNSVLYISNSDTAGLNKDIYHLYIFDKLALKKVQKIKFFDFIFVENITFLDEIYKFQKKSILIAAGFSKNDLLFFKNRKTRVLKFVLNEQYFALFSKNAKFKYFFKRTDANLLFKINNYDFSNDIDFYLSCLEQGFRFYDFRNSRKNEILEAFAYGNIYFDGKEFVQNYSKKTFLLNDKLVNEDFIPSGFSKFSPKILSLKSTKKSKKQIKFKNFFRF